MNGPSLRVSLPDAGLGINQLVPAASTNGTPLPARPPGAQGARFYLGSGDSVSYALTTDAQGAPTSAPPASSVVTIPGPGVFDEVFPLNISLYITATTGTPKMRWM